MANRQFAKQVSRKRYISSRAPLPRVLVLTGGEITERDYLNWLVEVLELPKSNFKIINTGFDARRLSEMAISSKKEDSNRAKREKDSSNVYDSIWIVIDVDNSPILVKEAIQLATNNGISVAVSNPCFEVWLNFHVTNSTAPATIESAQKLAKTNGLVSSENKKIPIVDKLLGNTETAKRNAAMLRKHHEDSGSFFPNNTPSSGMDFLVEEFQDFSEAVTPGLKIRI